MRKSENKEELLLSYDELSEALGISKATIARWLRVGLPSRQPGINRKAFNLKDVVTWMQNNPKYCQFLEEKGFL